jgi:hypothetical protein
MEDLSIWAMLIVCNSTSPGSSFSNIHSPQSQRLATLETPPDRLKLADKCIRQSQMKRRAQPAPSQLPAPLPAQPTVVPTATQSPDLMQMMMMMLGTAVTAFANNSGARDRPRVRQFVDGNSSSPSPPLQHAIVPSKRPKSVAYLELKDWLKDLEVNPARNKYGEPFSKYSSLLVDSLKLYTTEDIISLSPSELSAIGGMEFGTASRMIRYAREDAGLEPLKKARLSH